MAEKDRDTIGRKQLNWRGKGWQKPECQDQRGRLQCYSRYMFRSVDDMTRLDFTMEYGLVV